MMISGEPVDTGMNYWKAQWLEGAMASDDAHNSDFSLWNAPTQ
jgi:hypothetical protein